MPNVPETEALEQHPDSLAAFGKPVETAEQRQVLERGELAVDERLVAEVADGAALRQVNSPAVGAASPASTRRSVVFPEPFGPVTSRKPPAASIEVETGEDAPLAVALRQAARADHER